MPQISVIMTNYNKDKFLSQAINSLTAQTLEDFELIVVDDASTDSSKNILNSLAKKNHRIKLLSNSANMGPSYSRNKALRIATGKYFCFVDSDDVIRKERLEKMLQAIDSETDRIAYTHVCLIDEDGNVNGKISPFSRNFPPSGDAKDHILKEWIWAPSTFMIPASAIKQVGYYDESIRWGEDLDYLIRLTKIYKVAVVREPLYCYRWKKDGKKGSLNPISRDEATIKILEKVLKTEWNRLSDATKYAILVRILRTRRFSHVKGKIEWLLNPFFIRMSIKNQRTLETFIYTIMEDFEELYRKALYGSKIFFDLA